MDPESYHKQTVVLSLTERARFQRAFFRYELYSRVFPVDYDARHFSLVPANMQFIHFLACMEPWEAEEMSCVYHYFTSLIGRVVDDLEGQLVSTILATPGIRLPSTSIRSLSAERLTIYAKDDDGQSNARDEDEMVLFDHLDLRDLDLFSKHGRYDSAKCMGYLASLGSAFIYRLVLADGNQRKDMIRENAPAWRDFFPEALEHTPDTGPETVVADGFDDDQPSHPNLGYVLYKRSDKDVYLEINDVGMRNWPLRECAFVFWDSERILRPVASQSLRKARHMDYNKLNELFNRQEHKSAEEQLEGVRIPKAQMRRIIDKFGSLFDPLELTSSPPT